MIRKDNIIIGNLCTRGRIHSCKPKKEPNPSKEWRKNGGYCCFNTRHFSRIQTLLYSSFPFVLFQKPNTSSPFPAASSPAGPVPLNRSSETMLLFRYFCRAAVRRDEKNGIPRKESWRNGEYSWRVQEKVENCWHKRRAWWRFESGGTDCGSYGVGSDSPGSKQRYIPGGK